MIAILYIPFPGSWLSLTGFVIKTHLFCNRACNLTHVQSQSSEITWGLLLDFKFPRFDHTVTSHIYTRAYMDRDTHTHTHVISVRLAHARRSGKNQGMGPGYKGWRRPGGPLRRDKLAHTHTNMLKKKWHAEKMMAHQVVLLEALFALILSNLRSWCSVIFRFFSVRVCVC